MNINRAVLTAAAILFTALILFSCGNSGVTGVFVPKGKSRIKSVEFADGSARFTDAFLEIKQGRMKVDVKRDIISINDPIIGPMIFRIIDADTLRCEISGMSGLYIRQK
jgi:hypothetical protein